MNMMLAPTAARPLQFRYSPPPPRMDRTPRIVHCDGSPPRPEQPISPAPDLALALVTLRRGTRFLGSGLRSGPADATATAITGHGRTKVIGNGLREVDRFLSLLIDAVASGVATPEDRAALARLDNTARKLAMLRTTMALASPDDAALRAIGRSRNCLFHTGGIVRAGLPGSVPTLGWAAPESAARNGEPAPLPPGSHLAVTPEDLRAICRFYDRIADELVAALAGPLPPPRQSID
ncbi:hypothetical protein [Sphingomonas prati]|uniref:Uncharacterized protein n=2 Tax=Sphingomonas prati TaxID=1843237 RepID=A0A7W9F3R4_9SPHN|nr:hypothetical protein [Sphingomonas prati]MBB5730114.1 hypothetical protein [Sphingomonas prati]